MNKGEKLLKDAPVGFSTDEAALESLLKDRATWDLAMAAEVEDWDDDCVGYLGAFHD